MRRRLLRKNRELEDFIVRFYPAGNYTWIVPPGCTEVDVFLVGGGGGGLGYGGGSGGGYTKTYKADTSGYRDGGAIAVISGQTINIIVGKGGVRNTGGYSQFLSSSYRANGGTSYSGANDYGGGYGGSGGGADAPADSGGSRQGGSDGSAGSRNTLHGEGGNNGQGHTTRDFGESTGKRNAGGGGGQRGTGKGGASDYTEGSGTGSFPGGGYGGGGSYNGNGGDGTVLIRGKRYKIR